MLSVIRFDGVGVVGVDDGWVLEAPPVCSGRGLVVTVTVVGVVVASGYSVFSAVAFSAELRSMTAFWSV